MAEPHPVALRERLVAAYRRGGFTNGYEAQKGEGDSGGAAEPPNLGEYMKEDIWNTICPVCGSQVAPKMLLVGLAFVSEGHQHQYEEQPGIRLCSKECAVLAEKSPEKFRAAAQVNSIAGNG